MVGFGKLIVGVGTFLVAFPFCCLCVFLCYGETRGWFRETHLRFRESQGNAWLIMFGHFLEINFRFREIQFGFREIHSGIANS